MNETEFKEEVYYKYAYKMLESGKRVAIVIDLDNKDNPSVTNRVDTITKKLNVEDIIYLATDKMWCYWSKKNDFDVLHVKDSVSNEMIPAPNFDIAWAIVLEKYLK